MKTAMQANRCPQPSERLRGISTEAEEQHTDPEFDELRATGLRHGARGEHASGADRT